MNNTNMSDKEIIKVANIAGIKLNLIKTTDLEGRFPPHIGGFSYDSEQIKSLSNFANEFVVNMQKTIEQKDALIEHLRNVLAMPSSSCSIYCPDGENWWKFQLEALALSSPVSEKAK